VWNINENKELESGSANQHMINNYSCWYLSSLHPAIGVSIQQWLFMMVSLLGKWSLWH